AAQARALTDGRTYCIPDDVKEMAVPVLAHRVVLRDGRIAGQGGEEDAIEEVLRNVPVPV
ncbi:MAG: ATPase, partial [Candidatus Dadabacteria bacterium]|nr:ATPase [Candidatus Dadabacteria bacterium]